MNISKKVLALGLSGLLAVSVVGGALADGPGGPGGAGGPGNHGRDRGQIIGAGLKEIASASGLSEDVFKQGFKDGKSINTILTENGKNPATVLAQVLADLKTRLSEAVTKGTISQERADAAYAKAQEGLPKLMDRVPTPGDRGDALRMHVGKGLFQSAADTIGITIQALIDEVRAGKTIAAVATENNVAPQKVVENAIAQASARIDQGVTDGKIKPEKAAEMKAKLNERITKFVNEVHEPKQHGAGNRPARP